MNFNGTTKTEPVPKVESVFKRKLALERGLHVKIEGKLSPDEDGDIIFVGPNSLSSAPAPGRYSCGGLCNHDAATTSAPTPVMARERKPVANPFVSSSRTLEVISLISDSEEDDGCRYHQCPCWKLREIHEVGVTSARVPPPGSRIPKKIYTATQKYTAEEFQQVPPSTRETSHLRDFSYCLNPLHLVAEPHLDNMRGTSHHEASAR
ncbi:hypothetical protein NW759_001576 [Fusarium solani]|nr:hypothetical protein NW759_001576 [Fusarium solani]